MTPFRVVVAGGGVAGIESLLALRELAGERIALTLLSPGDRFRVPAFAVAEPFALGHGQEVPYTRIAGDLGVTVIPSAALAVDDARRAVETSDGVQIAFDALLLTPGATMAEGLQGATTWRPDASPEIFGGLLRDLEQGYAGRIAFVVPAGPAWPLPAFELAMMTARHADGMGIDAEISVVCPDEDPLAFLGLEAAGALRAALADAGVRLVTGMDAHVGHLPVLHLAPAGSGDAITVDRIVALPALRGPRIAGVTSDEHGFIRTGPHGLVEGCTRTWAAGDGIASPMKMGGLASYQARRAAGDIARAAGVDVPPGDGADDLALHAVLMTGEDPVALDDLPLAAAAGAPRWWPARKVASHHLEAYLMRIADETGVPA